MAQTLKLCKVVDKFTFDSHPVLQATFDIGVQFVPREVWSLPRSADDLLFDQQTMQDTCEALCHQYQQRFQESLDHNEVDVAFNYMVQVFEGACQQSVVTTDGKPSKFPAGCLKKASAKLTK